MRRTVALAQGGGAAGGLAQRQCGEVSARVRAILPAPRSSLARPRARAAGARVAGLPRGTQQPALSSLAEGGSTADEASLSRNRRLSADAAKHGRHAEARARGKEGESRKGRGRGAAGHGSGC